ncbi:MAG TPA: hypothetical protein VFU43_01065 [Streptosporangiaceae bacterium]|nr:hypothetical protein [Streptosporangiaceae bacterium]
MSPESTHASRYRYLNGGVNNGNGAPLGGGGLDAIGIAVSGGGVRAACLGLGALQVVEESGIFRRTRYISAVSGGSYTATAFVAARARMRRVSEQGQDGAVRPWSRGSPEEAHLRRNLRYLGEDFADLCLGGARYVLTTLVNLVPFTATVVLCGYLLGAIYHATRLLAAEDDVLHGRHTGLRLLMVAAVVVVLEASIRTRRAERITRRAFLALVALLMLPDAVALSTRVLAARTVGVAAATRLAGLAAVLVAIAVYVFRSQWRFTHGTFRQLLRQTLRFLFSASIVAVMLLPLLLLTAEASQLPYDVTLAVAAGSLVLLLAFGLVVNANDTSLHRTYSRRLDRAYVVHAGTGDQDTGDGAERGTGGCLRLSQITLTDTHADGLPHLLLCASVNLREDESAEGEGCASFVFSADYVGAPAIGRAAPSSAAAELDAATLVAASGAAVAPNMGRYTGQASRIALALMNLRLGLWLPNPLVRQPRERPRGALRTSFAARWRRPGPLATWGEALGNLSIRHRYLFISDGGHWDNSGIVELLRRRCRTVFAVDAAIDEYRLGNLLRMIALARSELGVEFEADGSLLQSRSPIEKIRFRYPEDTADSPANYLILLRTHISQEMPSDLVALASGRGSFPRHTTLNQFLRAREVDAYIALGRWLFQRGLHTADLMPSDGAAVEGTSTAFASR